jgi:hypothetical protein
MLPFTKTLIEFKTDISGSTTSQKYDESLHGYDNAHLSPGAHIKLSPRKLCSSIFKYFFQNRVPSAIFGSAKAEGPANEKNFIVIKLNKNQLDAHLF